MKSRRSHRKENGLIMLTSIETRFV